MGKISDYANVLKSKLTDLFVVYQRDNGELETKNATLEQLGDAICGEQVHATLETDDQTIIGGLNENKDKVGDLSALTTTVKSSLVGAINEIATYTPVYGNTASGAIATFDTSLALPLQDCTIAINAVQESGTPSPDNVRPITGFSSANVYSAGKNLLPTHADISVNSGVDVTYYIGMVYLKKGVTYTFSCTQTPSRISSQVRNSFQLKLPDNTIVYGSNNVTIPSFTYTAVVSGLYQVHIWSHTLSESVVYSDFQIELGSTATDYEAYNGTTTPITWQSEAGTVYGGSLDVTTGVLTVTHKGLNINSSSNFVSFSVGTGNANATFNLTDAAIETSGVGSKKGAISSTGQENPLYWSADRKNETPDNGNMSFAINGNGTTVRFYITENFANISTIDDFKNAFIATTLVYPLATPVTYQLTPTQISAIVGTNNVFTDTNGNTSVVYACSLKDYIDSQ